MYPGYTAVRFHDGALDAVAAAARISPQLATALRLVGSDEDEVRREARGAFEEVLAYWQRTAPEEQSQPLREERAHVLAHLLVVLAEGGDTAAAGSALRQLGDAPEERRFVALVQTAYPDLREAMRPPSDAVSATR